MKKIETRGRNKIDPSKKINKQVNTRLNDKDYKQWKEYARQKNKSESEILRNIILNEIKKEQQR